MTDRETARAMLEQGAPLVDIYRALGGRSDGVRDIVESEEQTMGIQLCIARRDLAASKAMQATVAPASGCPRCGGPVATGSGLCGEC